MNAAENTFADGQTVWVVSRHRIEAKKVRAVSTHSGKAYVAAEHGEDCYLRFGAGRGAEWIKSSDVCLTERGAKIKFAAVLRLQANAYRKQADDAIAQAEELEREAKSST